MPVPATSSRLLLRVKPRVPLRCTALPKSTVTLALACNKVPRLPSMPKAKLVPTPVATESVVVPAL